MSPAPRLTEMAVGELASGRAPYNPRKISTEEYEQLRASLERFGFVDPVIWNERTGTLVGGHQRLDAAESLKIERVPVAIVDLPENEERALNLALNKIHGEWDFSRLRELLGDLPDDLAEAAGFDAEERAAIERDGHLLHLEMERLRAELENYGGDGEDGGGDGSDPGSAGEPGSLAERFLVPPFSVLDARAGYWQARKLGWLGLGIQSEVGRDENLLGMSETVLQAGARSGTSVFDPVLCELAYRWFAPEQGKILDPFAGGSVRGIVAGALGFPYTGVELRKEQVEANREQAQEIRDLPESPRWIAADSSTLGEGELAPKKVGAPFDFLFSCPPYFDLEVYSKDPQDLSGAPSWEAFLAGYREVIRRSVGMLRDHRFAAFVVSEIRAKDSGFCRGFVSETIRAFEQAGARYYSEAIMVQPVGTLALRAARIFNGGRKLGRCHQTLLVFCKGDPAKAAKACGEIGELDLPGLDGEGGNLGGEVEL